MRQKDILIWRARKGISHTSLEKDIFAYLTDRTGLKIWRQAREAIIEFQGPTTQDDEAQWAQAKARASEILNLALLVLERYDSDECRNILSSGCEDIDASIEAQLNTLLSFDSIYSRESHNDKVVTRHIPHHDFKQLFENFSRARRDRIKTRRKKSHSRTHLQVSTSAT